MSNNKNGIGEQINSALSDALKTGDFANLNSLVFQTASDALNEAGKHISQGLSGKQAAGKSGVQPDMQKEKDGPGTQFNAKVKEASIAWNREKQEQLKRHLQNQKLQLQKQQFKQHLSQRKPTEKQPSGEQLPRKQQAAALVPVQFKEVGSVSNVLYQVFGGIGLGLSSLTALIRLPGLFYGAFSPVGWGVNLAFIAGFFLMIRRGVGQRNRLKRAKRYIQLCGSRMYGQIEHLARDTGNSARYVIKDIKRMLSLGMFPEGHLDSQKTCLMLDDKVHKQYLEAESSRKQREEADIKQKEAISIKETDKQPSSMDSEQESELNAMVAEGMECVRKLRELNDRIPGEVISEKLSRLENLLKDIFDSVREHPEQMHRIHKLMDYYLPTTLKLVEAYEDFDKINAPSEEIIAAKAEIERTLDIINQAFTELLNNLFQDAVFDATTDAQVLRTMLAKEGLTGNRDFKKQSPELL